MRERGSEGARAWGSERLRRDHESWKRGKSLTRSTTRRCAVEFDACRVTQSASARLKPTAFATLPNTKTALRADTKTPPSEATRKCTIRTTEHSLAKMRNQFKLRVRVFSWSGRIEWEVGVGVEEWNYYHSFLEGHTCVIFRRVFRFLETTN